MGKYKVCVYAICKNEEQFVDRWMDSMDEADEIVVTDTGSTDGTVEKLRARGAVVYVDEVKPWRFDVARNISLSHVPDDIDICVCTDLDEVLVKGWRECLEKAWTPDTTRGRYIYNWSLKPDGTPGVQFQYFKVHTKKDYTWKSPVHEYIGYIGKTPEKVVFIDGLVLNHYPDNSKSRSSYLPILENAVKEDPEDDRINYYLGREYMYKGEWQKCIDTLESYLTLKKAVWNEERSAAMRWIAYSYSRLSKNSEAYRWYYRAIAEAPYVRDPYVEFARLGYMLGDWVLVFFMVEEALEIKNRSQTYVNMDYSWDFTPDDLGSISCYWIGMLDRSLMHAKAALSFSPNDERLKNNLVIIEDRIKKIEAEKPKKLN
jgi:glycosyltransferase involved in cell wall biosynthesis